jgi:hypothetical protein
MLAFLSLKSDRNVLYIQNSLDLVHDCEFVCLVVGLKVCLFVCVWVVVSCYGIKVVLKGYLDEAKKGWREEEYM